MAAELTWTRPIIYGGFSFALVVMGGASPLIGRAIDRYGGRYVLAGGSVCCAIGCVALARSQTVVGYYAAWLLLGLAMRSTLYEAAFAALVRIGGRQARGPIAKITLLGGLASTCFWPIGHTLSEVFGWRGALHVYALVALAIIPLYLAIPSGRYQNEAKSGAQPRPASPPSSAKGVALLYALLAMLSNGLNSALSAHMVGILSELGLAAALAVTASSLRGIGQSAARLAEVLFGGRLHPIVLNLMAAFVMPLCFVVGLASGQSLAAAMAFTFFLRRQHGHIDHHPGDIAPCPVRYNDLWRLCGKAPRTQFSFRRSIPAPVRCRHRALRCEAFVVPGAFPGVGHACRITRSQGTGKPARSIVKRFLGEITGRGIQRGCPQPIPEGLVMCHFEGIRILP